MTVQNMEPGISAGIEALFAEVPAATGIDPFAQRVRAAADHNVHAVEICGWQSKDLRQLQDALVSCGVSLHTMCVDPMEPLTDPARHHVFLDAIAASARVANRLGCPFLVTSGGDGLPGGDRPLQRHAVVAALHRAAPVLEQYGVTLLLENLNSRVDHVGVLLDSTSECLDILDEVASSRVRFLFDLYHSLVMGEHPRDVLAGRIGHVAHVQIADVPGRHEPGSGNVDWHRELAALREIGYRGRIGLEYIPSSDTATSLDHIRGVLREVAGS